MDLKNVQSELQKLSEIINGWDGLQEVTGLERDLVLEKLRSLYDAVRFGSGVVIDSDSGSVADSDMPEERIPAEISVSIDLDEVLSMDLLPDEEPEYMTEGASEQQIEEESAETGSGSEFRTEAEADEAAPAQEEAAHTEYVSEPESEPEPTEETASGQEDASAPEAEEEELSDPEPQSAAPTLFGVEVETSNHRHRQRVIMSLYNTDMSQTAAAKPAEPVRETPESDAPAPQLQQEWLAQVPAETERETESIPEPETDEQFEPEVSGVSITIDTDEDFEEITIEAHTPAGAVLGEVIGHDVQTLADTISAPRDMASELRSQETVSDLRRAIGINDKFLMIRDLFGGDAAAYDRAIDTLNAFDDLDDCMIHIAENYVWNANSDGAKFLMELLERKLA